MTKTKTRRTRERVALAKKFAGAVPAAAPLVNPEVHVHPVKIEVYANGELLERIPNGAAGSDAAVCREKLLAANASVGGKVRHFNAQGVEIE